MRVVRPPSAALGPHSHHSLCSACGPSQTSLPGPRQYEGQHREDGCQALPRCGREAQTSGLGSCSRGPRLPSPRWMPSGHSIPRLERREKPRDSAWEAAASGRAQVGCPLLTFVLHIPRSIGNPPLQAHRSQRPPGGSVPAAPPPLSSPRSPGGPDFFKVGRGSRHLLGLSALGPPDKKEEKNHGWLGEERAAWRRRLTAPCRGTGRRQ